MKKRVPDESKRKRVPDGAGGVSGQGKEEREISSRDPARYLQRRLKLSEVAEYCQVPLQTVKLWVKHRWLRPENGLVKIGNNFRVDFDVFSQRQSRAILWENTQEEWGRQIKCVARLEHLVAAKCGISPEQAKAKFWKLVKPRIEKAFSDIPPDLDLEADLDPTIPALKSHAASFEALAEAERRFEETLEALKHVALVRERISFDLGGEGDERPCPDEVTWIVAISSRLKLGKPRTLDKPPKSRHPNDYLSALALTSQLRDASGCSYDDRRRARLQGIIEKKRMRASCLQAAKRLDRQWWDARELRLLRRLEAQRLPGRPPRTRNEREALRKLLRLWDDLTGGARLIERRERQRQGEFVHAAFRLHGFNLPSGRWRAYEDICRQRAVESEKKNVQGAGQVNDRAARPGSSTPAKLP